MRIIAIWVALLVLVRAQGAPDSATAAPELDALRSSYQRNMATIATARETRTESARKSYVAELERLQREITTTGDLDGALQVKAERERFAGNHEPTATERKAMAPALANLRTRYEKDIEPTVTLIRNAEDQQKRDYLAALDRLQRQFTTQNQLAKATLVRTERETIAGPAAPNANAGAAAATPPPGLSPSAVAGAGQLDPGFAAKIAAAVHDKKFALSELSRPKGGAGNDVPDEGAVLVGFEFFETKSNGYPDIRSLRPIFLTTAGVKPGMDRGKMEKVTNKVIARPGYAVGGINVYHTNNDGRIQGLQVIFMKMVPAEGRLDHSSSSTYRSLWFGTLPHKDKPKELGGDGRPVVGVYGFHGADCDCIGIVQVSN